MLRGPDRLPGPANTFLVGFHADDVPAGDSAYEPGRVVQPHRAVAEINCPQTLDACRRPALLIHIHAEMNLHVVSADARHRTIIHAVAVELEAIPTSAFRSAATCENRTFDRLHGRSLEPAERLKALH
ncbi:hypothetical protein GCM10010393_15880 [Streptomyces gobitricini]|uniref:Uncharacterized protein n=1 Tax=Streptomyces gobitricini TaxID=68211 RepID=A0ABP5YT41_9ACTN